jgi:hypothetical protein
LSDFITGDNVIILLGIIGTFATIVALIQSTRAIFASEKRRAVIDISLFVVLCAFSVGIFYYWTTHRVPIEDTRLKSRVIGLLKAAHSEQQSLLMTLGVAIPIESDNFTSPVSPRMPQVFSRLLDDGEVFQSLSKRLQGELPAFIKGNDSLTQGYKLAYDLTKKGQRGTLRLMFYNNFTQEILITIELLLQTNKISESEALRRQDAWQRFQTALFLSLKGPSSWVQPFEVDYGNSIDPAVLKIAFCLGEKLNQDEPANVNVGPTDHKPVAAPNGEAVAFRSLGFPLNYQEMLSGLKKGTPQYDNTLALLETGLLAMSGDKMHDSFVMGYYLLATLNDFELYIKDAEFHATNHQRVMGEEAETINMLINKVGLPNGIAKSWVKLFSQVLTLQPEALNTIQMWKSTVQPICATTGSSR